MVVFALLSTAELRAAPRIPWTTGKVTGSPTPPSPYQVQRLFGSIQFEHPVDLAFAPGTNRLFVADQSGKLWSFVPGSNRSPDLAIDLRRHHRPFDNVLGFTFHPRFASNRQIFINYNEPGGRTNGSFISRFTVNTSDPPVIEPASEKVIIRWYSGGHNGCGLAFGPDGFLYFSTGDAADPDPPDGKLKTGQDNRDLLSSILRIDVDGATGTTAYRIPGDNPFVNAPNCRPEIWAFGFRNPFRICFDRVTGELWAGDVGWEQWEMIDRVERGGNYGWSITEGPNLDVRRDVQPGPGPIRPAMVALPHSEAASITGGQVYHGRRLTGLRGAYIYGDWETGKFWALRQSNGRLNSNDELCDTSLKPVAFALDAAGELLILDYNGGLYEFTPNNSTDANQDFPRRLSQTGLFDSTKPLTPAAGTIPYGIAAPMWNDHATASWLLAIPGSNAIATTGGVGNIAGGTWAFPSNTVLARTSTLEFAVDQPGSVRPIETQLLHWDGQAWNPYTYRWRPDATDADLVGPTGTNDLLTVVDAAAPGGKRATPWRYMSRSECLRCHNAWAGEALTLNWLQLGSPDAEESQLLSLVNQGALRLRSAPGSVETLAYPYDDSFLVAERVRAWLHVNCSTCHRNGAGGSVALHLNVEKRNEELRAIHAKPARGDFGLVDARVIAPGDPFRSTLYYRVSTEGAGRMPHIGSRLVDVEGVRLLRDWIESLPADPAVRDGKLVVTERLSQQTPRELARLAGPERDDAIARLLSTMNGALALLDRVGARDTWRTAVAQAAARHTNMFVRDLFQRLLPAGERRATLGNDIRPEAILALRGDAVRGRELFAGAAQCVQCHPLTAGGRAFGPDLRDVGRKYPRAELLEQILSPSKIIAPEFRLTSVTLKNGDERSGFVVRRSAREIVLKDQNFTEHSLKPSDIADQREMSLSAMPEGLLGPLTAQEASDLLAFLQEANR